MSRYLDNKIPKSENRKVMISNFTDLQGNPVELGRFLAERLSIEMTNTDLKVIDRSGTDSMVKELQRRKDNGESVNVEQSVAKMVGAYYLITGTITLFDTYIEVTVKALDLYAGTLVSGTYARIYKTDGIRALTVNPVRSGNGNNSANSNNGRRIDTHDRSATDDIHQATISDLRKSECEQIHKDAYNKWNVYYGQICFENQTGQDLMFYSAEVGVEGWLDMYKTTLRNKARDCSILIPVNWSRGTNENTSKQATFIFYSADRTKQVRKTYVLDKCKVKSIVLTTDNFAFTN